MTANSPGAGQRSDANRGEPSRCPRCGSYDNFHPLWCGEIQRLSERVQALEHPAPPPSYTPEAPSYTNPDASGTDDPWTDADQQAAAGIVALAVTAGPKRILLDRAIVELGRLRGETAPPGNAAGEERDAALEEAAVLIEGETCQKCAEGRGHRVCDLLNGYAADIRNLKRKP